MCIKLNAGRKLNLLNLGNKTNRQISKRMWQVNNARQIFQKRNICYPQIRVLCPRGYIFVLKSLRCLQCLLEILNILQWILRVRVTRDELGKENYKDCWLHISASFYNWDGSQCVTKRLCWICGIFMLKASMFSATLWEIIFLLFLLFICLNATIYLLKWPFIVLNDVWVC